MLAAKKTEIFFLQKISGDFSTMTQRTHWDDCWKSGPAHYECAVWEVKSLQAEKDAIKVAAWDKSAEALKQLNEAIDRAKKAEAEYARIAGDYSEEASYLRKRAEQAEAEVERLEKDNAEWQDGYSALTAEVERLREYAQERALLHSARVASQDELIEHLSAGIEVAGEDAQEAAE
jgi:predicted RNase H-like nuclease (RuvC/YqgF family)